jgi:hypothetical protein
MKNNLDVYHGLGSFVTKNKIAITDSKGAKQERQKQRRSS